MNKQTILSLVKRYVKKVKATGIPVDQVIIFGSQVKGSAHKWSDIDTCIVSSEFGRDRQAERLRLMMLTDRHTDIIEPHPYHPTDLANTYDSLANEIRMHGIRVV